MKITLEAKDIHTILKHHFDQMGLDLKQHQVQVNGSNGEIEVIVEKRPIPPPSKL